MMREKQFITVIFLLLGGPISLFSLRTEHTQRSLRSVKALLDSSTLCRFVLKSPDNCNVIVPKTLHSFLSFTYRSKHLLDCFVTPVYAKNRWVTTLRAPPTYPSILCVQSPWASWCYHHHLLSWELWGTLAFSILVWLGSEPSPEPRESLPIMPFRAKRSARFPGNLLAFPTWRGYRGSMFL